MTAGPVLGQGWEELGARFFFGRAFYSNDIWTSHVGLAVQALERTVASASSIPITCRDDPSWRHLRHCGDPRSVLAAFTLFQIRYFEIELCTS